MAQIDPSIALSIKPAQIESPLVHAARAAELQNVQQSQFMNMLKLKEHVDESRTKNNMVKWLAGKPNLDDDKNINYLATQFGPQGLALAKQIDDRRKAQGEAAYRAEQTEDLKSQRSKRTYELGKTQFTDAISTISNLPNRQAAIDMLYQARVNKTIPDDAAENILRMLPNTEDEFPEFKRSLIEKLASADARLQHEDRVNKNKQEQIAARRTEFNRIYSPLAITNENDVRARVTAEYNDPILGPELQRYGSLNNLITREVADFNRNKPAYIGRLAGVSAEKLLESDEQKFKEEYFAHVRQAIANKTKPMSEEAFMASRRQISSAAVSAQLSAAETPVSDGTAPGVQEVQGFGRNVPRPVIDASAAVAPNAAVSPEAARALAPAVAKQQAEYTIHPDAQAYYDLFALTKNQADKAAGDAIQNAYIKQIELQNKPDQLMSVSPGGVVIDKATGEVKYTAPAAAEKPEPRTEAQKNYDAAVVGGYPGTFADFLDQQRESADEREWRKAVKKGEFKGTFVQWKQALRPVSNTFNAPAVQTITVQGPNGPELRDARTGRRITDDRGQPLVPYDASNKPLSPVQQQKLAKDRAADDAKVTAAKDMADDIEKNVDALLGNKAKKIKPHPGLPGITGYNALIPSLPGGQPRAAQQLLDNIKGKVTMIGKNLASQEGKLGNMAVQEWKIVADALERIDAAAPNFADQLQNVVRQARRLETNLKARRNQVYAAPSGGSDIQNQADAIVGR